ncbi:MAG: tetratricopeptide repeat protein [Lachnospiraceae bacterium]|nr:tetratricopeptide repeat protein [Lachnospiraceae bacterium]
MICIFLLSGCGSAANSSSAQEASAAVEEDTVYTLIEDMKYEEALALLETLELGEQESLRVAGICYMGQGLYEEAVEAFEAALACNGGFIYEIDYDINRYLAVSYNKLGEYEKAEEVYAAICALQPKDADAQYMHGVTYLELGQYENAVECFDAAVALAPTDYDLMISIYQALAQYGYRALGEEYIADILDNSASISDYDRGRVLYYTGEYSQAIVYLEKVKSQGTQDVILYLAMSYEALGDYNYAANVYISGLELGESAVLYNQLGLCQLKRGLYEEALEAFTQGLACNDTSLRQNLRYNQIVAYEMLGDFDTAKELMESYVSDYPGDEEALREALFLESR